MLNTKKKKKKMENSLSRLETNPIPIPIQMQEKSSIHIGCMSGIFQFLSRHSHSHKRLPSAGRRKKNAKEMLHLPEPKRPTLRLPEPKTPTSMPEKDKGTMQLIIPDKTFCVKQIRRNSCEVQRSPTLPSEIRRSSVEISQLDSPCRPTPLVVRLMGLDEVPTTPSPKININEVDQKRRKLLGALERCDEDLKSLKKIIDVVRTANGIKKEAKVEGKFASAGSDMDQDGESSLETSKSIDSSINGEQPSPISVLEAILSPKCGSNKSGNNKRKVLPITATQLSSPKPSVPCIPKPSVPCISGIYDKNDQETKSGHTFIFHQMTIERLPRTPKQKEVELPEEYSWAKRVIKGDYSRGRWRSNALVDNVGEVCENGIWEQRREFGRICVGLERGIFGDLVEEFVREILGVCLKVLISQGTCRKRLCY